MKKIIYSTALWAIIGIALPYSVHSQNVGINTTGATPSTNAILDLNTGNSGNLGLIIPHVEIGSSLTTFGMAHSVTTKDSGMVVYNMNSRYHTLGFYCWGGASTGWTSVTPVTGANNGLNLNGTNVQLGGTLLGNTSIASGGYNLSFTGTGSFQLGTASSSTGELDFFNSGSSKTIGISAGIATSSYTLTLPTSAPTANGQVLSGTTGGTLSWATPSTSLTASSTTGSAVTNDNDNASTSTSGSGTFSTHNTSFTTTGASVTLPSTAGTYLVMATAEILCLEGNANGDNTASVYLTDGTNYYGNTTPATASGKNASSYWVPWTTTLTTTTTGSTYTLYISSSNSSSGSYAYARNITITYIKIL